MAIAQMTKVMIVSYREEAAKLLEALQHEGIVQILDAERAMVTKNWPELHIEGQRPRNLEELIGRLSNGIAFLKSHFTGKELTSALRPRLVIDSGKYAAITNSDENVKLLVRTEALASRIEQLGDDKNHYLSVLKGLDPWVDFDEPVESLHGFESANGFAGIVANQKLSELTEALDKVGAVIEEVSVSGKNHACIVLCLSTSASDVHKILRNFDFETTNFEGMEGTATELIKTNQELLKKTEDDLAATLNDTEKLAERKTELKILFDHYQNLLSREKTMAFAPETDHTVIFEGWTKIKDYARLEKVVSKFSGSSVGKIDISEGEVPPVEIDNNSAVRPFEVITRLYGMPAPTDVDPTAYLAPFFALFFGLCLTDAGYGIIMVAMMWWVLKKIQGDTKAPWMMMSCSILTIIAGALTGGWFGDSVQVLAINKFPWMNNIRESIMLFDPMSNPMPFFKLSLGLGYAQILFGLCIAFYNNIRRKEYVAAVCENLSWLIFLNSLVLYGFFKSHESLGIISTLAGWFALSQVVVIFLFTERNSGLAGRIGGGTFALFSTVFYLGDVLSYVRLMALGMVTAGLGIAVNILVKLVMDVPYVGFILGALLFVGGHMFNLAMSTLSSFVHSLRLQFVEFFPKFLVGGGHDFRPIKNTYEHISIEDKQ
ncbi:MAG: V-type ATP synthase subunit I [Anaerohalosphaera sp.]|nr:V-type ATP synthase subunit I [Anaerohalosphaera sp.]